MTTERHHEPTACFHPNENAYIHIITQTMANSPRKTLPRELRINSGRNSLGFHVQKQND